MEEAPGELEEEEQALRGLEVVEEESAQAVWRTAWPPVPPRSGCSRSVWRAAAEDALRNNLDIVSR